MLLRDRCILLISPEPWEGLRMSKHHWAEALAARGNRVLWLDQPGSVRGPVRITPSGVVERVAYHHSFRGVNRMPRAVQRWYHDGLLRRIERAAGRPIDVIWSFDTSRFLAFSRRKRLWIMHPVDLAVAVRGTDALRQADQVLTVSDALASAIASVAPEAKVLVTGHGLDARWLNPNAQRVEPDRVRPKVCCAGNMAIKFLDWELIAQEVHEHPEVDFRFIGPCAPEPNDEHYSMVRASTNAYFTGLLDQERLMEELHAADALLLCYRADRWPSELSNSHKLLEYLATGKPVVASFTQAYADAPEGLLYMARERWTHADLLRTVLADIPAHNTAVLQQRRRDHAQGSTIEQLLDRVERSLAP